MNTSSIVLGEISEYFELDNRILVIQNLDEPEPYGCEYWATLQQADSFDIIYDGNEPFLFNLFAIDDYFNAIIIIDHNMVFRYYDCNEHNSENLINIINDIIIEAESNVGDMNEDGGFNIQDVIILANLILNHEDNPQADINGDELINVQDIVRLINIILN